MDSKLTPMMKQYLDIKKKHQDDILFFRMGDFYEMFFDDAHIASKILDIALTSRQNDVPMCGIPYHAADSYIARLLKAGKRVAICEQMENVPTSGTIVRRDVIRIVTPGTVIESHLLQSDDNNFLGSVIIDRNGIGLAFIDISTGDFFLSSIGKTLDIFRGEMARFTPTEVVLKEGDGPGDEVYAEYIRNMNIPVYRINDWLYDVDYMKDVICDVFGTAGTQGLGLTTDLDIAAAGSILQYLKETQKQAFSHLKHPQVIIAADRMVLDDATISNLELTKSQQDGSRSRTLFDVLNYTMTPMGRRALERNLTQPLLNVNTIEQRLDIVQYLYEYRDLTKKLQGMLDAIFDIERLITRFAMGRIFPRNFLALRDSLAAALEIKRLLSEQPHESMNTIGGSIPDLAKLAAGIRAAIEDDPALSPEHGRVIRKGFSAELDRLYELKTHGKEWIIEYQEDEKKRLGLNTLKVRYNKILGYFIELSKAQAAGVPGDYFRKQTLVGNERFTTEKLQRFETDILSASDQVMKFENTEMEKLKDDIIAHRQELQDLAGIIGELDFYASLARAALENRYTRPLFNLDNKTSIVEGRHPVVEKFYTREVFIPNDIILDGDENIIKIITGPNMSGKSTYIRMYAVIQLMSQIGSFVPAKHAEISIADRIFTRIGASDNISRGESTFLVEMNETANILNNATSRSIIIMDEVGRGTSTYDGLSIAWGIVEYIARYLKAKTLFATHYHELTRLGNKKGIINYNVLVREHLNGVDFLHKVTKGAADKSYGIHVAKLAGIPRQIVGRAGQILEKLEKSGGKSSIGDPEENGPEEQLEIFNTSNHLVIQAIRNIELDRITPLDALNELQRLKKLIE